ncbi:MAG: hypothetical protein FWH11_11390 [Micrococcales bacterium]|nr:hypothetical protein [Micrococcales bacterium]
MRPEASRWWGRTWFREAPKARKAVVAIAVLAVLVALLLWVPARCARDPLAGVPTLSVGPVPEVHRPQLDQKFRQATVLGHTYTLPCPGSAFLDNGWSPYFDDVQPVDAHGSDKVDIVRDGMRLELTLRNYGDEPAPWDQAQVVEIRGSVGQHGPIPQIQPDMAKEDVVALLGTPDVDEVRNERENYSIIVYHGLPVQSARLLDTGLSPGSVDGSDVLYVDDVSLVLSFLDDRYFSYTLSYDLGEPFDPARKIPGGDVQCGSFPDEPVYSYRMHPDLFFRHGPSTRPAEYLVDGQAYVFGVSGSETCDKIDPDKSSAQKVDDYLLAPGTLRDPLSGPGEPFLLWDGEDSSAAVLVFRGEGQRTGDDYVQVWLSYCDWENGFRVRMSFSVISVEEGAAVSEGAQSYLLSVVSEVAESMTKAG